MTTSPAATSSAPSPAAAVLAVLVAAALFGTTGTSQALGPGDTTALGVGAVRLAVGALALWLAARLAPDRPAGGRRWRGHGGALLVGGLAVAAYQLCWFVGLRRTGVAIGTIVGIGSGPIFAGILHRLRGRGGLPRAWYLGTVLSVLGAGLLAFRGAGGGAADALGLLFTLGAGLSYAIYTEAAKHAMERGLDASGTMAGVFTVGALLVAPLLLLEPLGWLATGRGAALALHLGVLTIGVAYWLYGWSLRTLPAPTVVTLTLAEPLTASILGATVLGEALGLLGWLGGAGVAAGLLVAGRGRSGAGEG